MLADRDAAADCVQEVFCTAAAGLGQLHEPDKLRPWLYAIARNEALRCIRARRREQLSEEVPEMTSAEAGPDTLAARNELADLIAEAAGGLSDRDRSVLELAYRHGLDGPELAEALEISPGHANKLVSRLRQTIEQSPRCAPGGPPRTARPPVMCRAGDLAGQRHLDVAGERRFCRRAGIDGHAAPYSMR
jgi:RNA polymerase sigma factor (sigma-70 family)